MYPYNTDEGFFFVSKQKMEQKRKKTMINMYVYMMQVGGKNKSRECV